MSKRSEKELIIELLNSMFGDDSPHKEGEVEEVLTKTEGFDSFVSEEEYEAIKGVSIAFKNYINVHNKCAIKLFGKINGDTIYQQIQYALLIDTVSDAMEAVAYMIGIHTCDKEFIDELCKETDNNLDGLLRDVSFKLLERKLKSKLNG